MLFDNDLNDNFKITHEQSFVWNDQTRHAMGYDGYVSTET